MSTAATLVTMRRTMTLAELKRAMLHSHERADRNAGASPPGMREAVEALSDMTLFKRLQMVPYDLVVMVESAVKVCEDYQL